MYRRHTIVAVLALGLFASGSSALAAGGGERITDWIRAFWPIAMVGGGLVITGVLLALGTRFAPAAAFNALRSRVDKLERDCTVLDLRAGDLEKVVVSSPTRLELQEDIAELGERMKGVEATLAGVGTQLGTTNTYLHTLIEKGLRAA